MKTKLTIQIIVCLLLFISLICYTHNKVFKQNEQGCICRSTATTVTENESIIKTGKIINDISNINNRVEYLESTSDWLVRFSSTLREDVFEEIEKYLDNMPYNKPCECKENIEAITRQLYKDFDEKVRIAVDKCLNGNDNSPAMNVVTRDDLNIALEEERAKYEKYVEDFMTDQGFNRPTVDPGDIEEVYNQMGELEKYFREFEDGVQQEFIKLEPLSKHQITNLVWRLVADAFMYHTGNETYPIGEYAKLLEEELNEKLEKKLKDMAKIERRLDNNDQTMVSMLKQLNRITGDIDELKGAGVGSECQGLDDATDSTFDNIFKKLNEQEKEIKQIKKIINQILQQPKKMTHNQPIITI